MLLATGSTLSVLDTMGPRPKFTKRLPHSGENSSSHTQRRCTMPACLGRHAHTSSEMKASNSSRGGEVGRWGVEGSLKGQVNLSKHKFFIRKKIVSVMSCCKYKCSAVTAAKAAAWHAAHPTPNTARITSLVISTVLRCEQENRAGRNTVCVPVTFVECAGRRCFPPFCFPFKGTGCPKTHIPYNSLAIKP